MITCFLSFTKIIFNIKNKLYIIYCVVLHFIQFIHLCIYTYIVNYVNTCYQTSYTFYSHKIDHHVSVFHTKEKLLYSNISASNLHKIMKLLHHAVFVYDTSLVDCIISYPQVFFIARMKNEKPRPPSRLRDNKRAVCGYSIS